MVDHDQRKTNGTNPTRARRFRSFRARRSPRLVGGAILLAGLLASGLAGAQMDVSPPLPNVMILLDTSGSMERLPNGQLPNIPTNAASTDPTQKSRWISALEVLGGSIVNYSAVQVPRISNSDFTKEYSLGATSNVPPYDNGYYLPHFRPMSNACTPGPYPDKSWPTWPTTTWGTSNLGWRLWGGTSFGTLQTANGTCGPGVFQQDGLGVLDTFRDQARFGLMTFDSFPDPGTGYNGQTILAGVNGQWSYFPGWDGSSTAQPQYGWPNNCDVTNDLSAHVYEVGARNPAAPPWEGPLVPFAANDSTGTLRAVNDQIRYAMLAARPYGATPIGPMMADAAYYFRSDPKGPSSNTVDPYNECRGNFIILITDGFPNEDLRTACQSNPTDPIGSAVWPSCATSGSVGCCPSKRAQDIAYDLANPPAGTQPVKTFVVGFALSDDSGNPIYCTENNTINGPALQPLTDCAPGSSYLTTYPQNAPCCTLNSIAFNGGTNNAFIASSADTLRAALVNAMSAATANTTTSRTVPVFERVASAGSSNSTQYQFLSSFKVNPFGFWQGTLERIRYQCVTTSTGTLPQEQPESASLGDDFSQNLNSSFVRNFSSWNGVVGTQTSSDSIRPNLTTSDVDGVEHTVGLPIAGTGSAFVTNANMTPAVMNVTAPCADTTTVDECKQKYLNYALALPQPNTAWYSRVGFALGDIYHATPVNVGAPQTFLRDESYTSFRNAQALRTPVLLVSTNDGLLHGFQTNVGALTQNELWAFVPPAVMPKIGAEYGGAHALLNDAAPVVRDVAFGGATSTYPWGRQRNDVKSGQACGGTITTNCTNWRTVAVGGLTAGRGYYALDVTDPTGPKFLWQLTTVGGKNLFGNMPGTPAIGTVYYSPGAGLPAVETPVAFLPGGDGSPFDSTRACARWVVPPTSSDPNTQIRSSVRCWSGPGQSFTVVRLYDGKILRTFRNNPQGNGTADHPSEVSTSPVPVMQQNGSTQILDAAGAYATIDSPITGAVSTYPAATGAITTRAFVGDIDGTLWKADVSSTDPTKWTFSIFHDAFVSPDTSGLIGQPIAQQPVITVNRVGDITVLYSTGDQNNFSSTNINQVWSVTEQTTTPGLNAVYATHANWHLRLTQGVTPTGPLSLFNQALFFSTFTPGVSSTGACLNGQGAIWGVHYLDTESSTSFAPAPRIPLDGDTLGAGQLQYTGDYCPDPTVAPLYTNLQAGTNPQYFRCITLPQGSIVFGAGVTQRPTCATVSGALTTDPYTGATSTHQTVSGIATGDFQLVAQTGPKATSSTSTTQTNTFVRTIVAPMSQTRIDSWASVVE